MNALGKISLILSTLCFVLTFAFKLALSGWMPFMGFGLGFALFFFVFSILVNFSFYKNLVRSESTQFVAQSLGFIAVLVVFLVALNYMGARYNKVFDLTEGKVNSLTDFSQRVVTELKEPVTFHYFYSDAAKAQGFERIVKSMVNKYQELSPMVQYQGHSIFQEPELAKKFQVGNEESSLFIVFKDRIHRVTELSEPEVTSGILQLTSKAKVVYFTQNHGEKQLNGDNSFGLSHFRQEMERLHYQLRALTTDKVPEDAAFIAVVGPRKPFSDEELEGLRSYVRRGGGLLLAIDPGEAHDLAGLAKTFGIEFQNSFVFAGESKKAAQPELSVFVRSSGAHHDILNSLDDKNRPLWFMGSSLKLAPRELGGLKVTPLLAYPEQSISYQDIDPKSPVVQKGVQLAAAIVEGGEGEKYQRVVVTGDSDFLSNQFFSQHGNFDFSLNLMAYLSKAKDIIGFRPHKAATTYLIMTQTQMNLYFLFFVVPFVLLFFIVALFLKLRRLF
ncbi:MAG: Gldg family protein [Bdellovibrionales bacterium]|nr:Gldg family protein [Bdellovibrionales bacterium]